MGVCGNYNGDTSDDTTTVNGVPEQNITTFAKSWQLTLGCKVATSSYNGACSRSSTYKDNAMELCESLRKGM